MDLSTRGPQFFRGRDGEMIFVAMSPFDARTTRERNGEMVSRGEVMSPFDARTTRERNGEMISRGEAMSPFDARALDFFGPLRRAGILKSIPLGEPIPIYDHLIF